MKKIPNMISSKDLSYISDMFNWNFTAAKKIEFYLESCEDEELCKELTKLNKDHIRNCQNLTKLLESSDDND
ncbi:MAG: hypothetical protein J6B98_05970 [Bacilli bacterium]|nr:hypothetical protein [Bacilli bacterium]